MSGPGPGRLVCAAPSRLAAAGAEQVARGGGGAVDAAIAAALVACVSEPGIVSLGGGAYVTVLDPRLAPEGVTVDGWVSRPSGPGPGTAGARELALDYGGGVTLTVGPASVAVPGLLPALAQTHRRFGRLPWAQVVEPARQVAVAGFPLGSAAAHYLSYALGTVFDEPEVRQAIRRAPDGSVPRGQHVVLPHLAGFLAQVAQEQEAALMRGPNARALVELMRAQGGSLTAADLAGYRPSVRRPAQVRVGRWQVVTNPPPAVGGPVLAALLALLGQGPGDLTDLLLVFRDVLGHRLDTLDLAADRGHAAAELLAAIGRRGRDWLTGGLASPSTAHVSVVDDAGTACALTVSSGYGAGVSVPGTGVWLNNCLGEHELTRGGLPPVGERLASNMAPTIAWRPDGAVLAAGSPGADRITTALAQVLGGVLLHDRPLAEAVDAPRAHLARAAGGGWLLHHEQDLDLSGLSGQPAGWPRRAHEPHSMFFGGVALAHRAADGRLSGAADPRRTGAVTRV